MPQVKTFCPASVGHFFFEGISMEKSPAQNRAGDVFWNRKQKISLGF
jgi:hypothetical protein